MFNTVHNDFTIFKHKISISTKYVNGEAANAYQSNAYQLNGTLAHPGIVKDVSCLCFGFIAEIPDTTPLLNIMIIIYNDDDLGQVLKRISIKDQLLYLWYKWRKRLKV